MPKASESAGKRGCKKTFYSPFSVIIRNKKEIKAGF